MITIGVVNESTVVTDAQVADCIAALHIQYEKDFAQFWVLGPIRILPLAKGEAVTPEWWELVVADNSDQVGALGYHETTAAGLPIGFVFAKDTIDAGDSWTVTASHEFLEMMADPDINAVVETDNPDGSYVFYAKEVCDACEDDSFGYEVELEDGKTKIKVSDFVLPAWFVPGEQGQYDFMKKITAPLQILQNGYIAVLDVSAGPQWTQLTGELTSKTAEQVAPTPYHRRARRIMGKQNWKRSER